MVRSIQPRIRLWRSFDERGHTYHGYVLVIGGKASGDAQELVVAIGKAAHAKHQFRVGDVVSGESVPVQDRRLETADLYKTIKLKVVSRGSEGPASAPPWHGVPPALEVYRERGHRRLEARTFASKCTTCLWGCRMAVEMIIDHWNPDVRKYRTETFCYGPLSCRLYKAGPARKVPGRRGMVHEEADWVDEEETRHAQRQLHLPVDDNYIYPS
jgi:hypothetical protein